MSTLDEEHPHFEKKKNHIFYSAAIYSSMPKLKTLTSILWETNITVRHSTKVFSCNISAFYNITYS